MRIEATPIDPHSTASRSPTGASRPTGGAAADGKKGNDPPILNSCCDSNRLLKKGESYPNYNVGRSKIESFVCFVCFVVAYPLAHFSKLPLCSNDWASRC